jgi:[amino group carrier protein]-lysine/ornithine hydrolase
MGIEVATTTRVDVAELLTAMLSVPSPSGQEDVMASLLVSRLLRAGFDVDVDAAGNVVAAWGDGPETVALVGHVDTVPGHIEVRRDGDLLNGRGAVDAKGPLATAIAAVSRQPRDGARRFVIVGAVEEETSSRGARHLAESMAAPSSLVILEPSGWTRSPSDTKAACGCARASARRTRTVRVVNQVRPTDASTWSARSRTAPPS